jgi:predicted dehydrogenase
VIDALAEISESTRIRVATEHRRGISIIGAGGIVAAGHLPAYSALGLDVVGIYDIDEGRACDLATRFEIDRVYDSVEDALADARSDVVDIAVLPWAQPDVARVALDAGKHLLCQKPLSPTLAEARELVEKADEMGLCLAVNQQLRWDEGIAAAHEMIRCGWIGRAESVTFNVDITTDVSQWTWLVDSDRFDFSYHSIHYFDAIRYLLGQPDRAFAHASRRATPSIKGETKTNTILTYADGRRAVVNVNHDNFTGDQRAEFRIEGTDGVIKGTLGLLYDYPHGRPDTLDVFSTALPTDGWLAYPVTERWIPTAFGGPMAGLLEWIATGTPSASNGRENLGTLALLEALYRSSETGDAQTVGAL